MVEAINGEADNSAAAEDRPNREEGAPRTTVVSFGCHAGLHRSVAIADAVVKELKQKKIHLLVDLKVIHRSLQSTSQSYRSKKEKKKGKKDKRR